MASMISHELECLCHYDHNYRNGSESIRIHRVCSTKSPMGLVGKMALGDLGVVKGWCWGNPTRLAVMAGGVATVPGGRALAAGGVALTCELRRGKVRFTVLFVGRGSRVEYSVSRGGPARIVRRPGLA